MIEREFVAQKTKEYYIKKYIESKLNKVGLSQIKLRKIPLGEKIIIYTSRPSLIVGSRGANIKDLTKALKQEFKLENPQIEINEVKDLYLDPAIVAEQIASSLERYGSARFKGVGHKMMENIMNAGARGVEIHISGKIPGARAKTWRFYQGYLKKCGDAAIEGVRLAKTTALLKSGVIGIKVAIMPPDFVLPDHVSIKAELEQGVTESTGSQGKESEQKDVIKKMSRKKTATKKRVSKKKEDSASKALDSSNVEKMESSGAVLKSEAPQEELPPKKEAEKYLSTASGSEEPNGDQQP